MRKFLLTFLSVALAISVVFAQEKAVSGKVTAEDGSGLPGVNVILKGTTSGTVTDVEGNFKLEVPETGAVLVFSFIGFETVEMVVGNQSVFDMQLTTEATQLTEVVVTALGISREKASLGYGVTTISSDAISMRPEADIGRILRGKAPGVEISQTSGLAGTGTNIIIRGFSTITGTNQPLFIVDGVPFNSDTNNDRTFVAGGATASSRFLDLDPNNIAEISILKGLSATVLYGEAGRNGVILVTTKTGKGVRGDRKGLEVSIDQNLAWSQIANLPDYQNSFGNGFSGNFGWFFSNWGPSFDTRGSNGIDDNGQIAHPYDQGQYNEDFPEFKDVRYDYIAYPSVENFFQTGIQSTTTLNISSSMGENGSVSFNYSNLSDNGIVPENKNVYRRNNLSFGAQTKLDNGLSLNTTFNLITSHGLKPPAASGAGSNPSGASLFANLIYTPRSMDLLNLPFQSPVDGSMIYYRRGSAIQNPLWTLHNASDEENIQRYFGQVTLNYEFTDWLNLTYRLGFDEASQETTRRINKGGSQIPDGTMQSFNRKTTLIDHVFNLMIQRDINEDFDFNVLVGANFRLREETGSFATSTEQFVFDFFTHQNFKEHSNFSREEVENTIGAYTTANLGFRDYAYLSFQGRNDWTSTLEEDNRSIFYPSISASFVLSEAIAALDGSFVDYLKVRIGYGTSAGYPDPYQTRNTLFTDAKVFVTQDGTSLDINSVSDQLGNRNLTPEKHEEVEFGIEAKFLENRIGLDLSLYDKNSTDLIINLDLDPATGFTNTTVNAAEVENKGIELALNFVPVRGDIIVDITVNYTKNINDVISIFEGVDQVAIGPSFDGVRNWAIPNEPYGVLQGTAYTKIDGQILVDASGIPVPEGDITIIGDPNPDWTGNLSGRISWKGISLYALLSYVSGGDIFSETTATMLARGNTVDTDVDRFLPLIFPGVKKDASGETVPNDIQAYIGDLSFRAYFFANEGGIFDATTLRLREVALSYDIPASILDNTPFGRASVRVTGQNLFYKAYNFPEGVNYDPDVLSTGVSNQRGMEFITGPTVKKYSVGISLTF